ncbi:MAG: hypothetical protein JOZ77_05405 [Candidatus Eremiobacteraeota bacterium]|nr:hypothetical protein [Candidatus Eremiobacteraeota bacterium]
MENVSAERSAGWSVLCYVAVLLLATFLNNGMPSIGARPIDIALAIDSHRFDLLFGAWLTFPAAAFFLWFLVGLRSYLANAPGRQEGLPMFALVAGVVMTATSLWAASILTAALYALPDAFKATGLASLYDAFVFAQGGLGYAPVSIFLFAAAHSMRRHDRAPLWLAWLGYLAAAGTAMATLSIFAMDSFMAPGQPGPGLLGAIPAAIWLIAVGIVLILQIRRGSAVESTSAAS